MTEREWLTCLDPGSMVRAVAGKVTDRKLRLFAVGCCRRLEAELPDQQSWNAVQVAEAYADGDSTEPELMEARRDAEASFRAASAAFGAVQATAPLALDAAEGAIHGVFHLGWDWFEEGEEQEKGQTGLLRDIFGPLLFRSVIIAPNLHTANVVSVGKAIYDDRAFQRMPILADALEDAGCGNVEILNHCRQPGEHVRGCWVLDLLLGKK